MIPTATKIFASLNKNEYTHPAVKLDDIENNTIHKTILSMPSKVGAFETAALVGSALTSGWLRDNQALMNDNIKAGEALYNMSVFGRGYIYETEARAHKQNKVLDVRKWIRAAPIEDVICRGFQVGCSLGERVARLSVCTEMTAEKFCETARFIEENIEQAHTILNMRREKQLARSLENTHE